MAGLPKDLIVDAIGFANSEVGIVERPAPLFAHPSEDGGELDVGLRLKLSAGRRGWRRSRRFRRSARAAVARALLRQGCTGRHLRGLGREAERKSRVILAADRESKRSVLLWLEGRRQDHICRSRRRRLQLDDQHLTL